MLLRIALVLLLVTIAYVANAFANPIPQRKFDLNFRPQYGVTYSFEQAGWYGLDPKQAYLQLLDEFDFKWVRLPFFWDQMTQLRQGYDGQVNYDYVFNSRFDDLEFAIEEADKRGVKVIVVLGAKTPYYPEFHLPANVRSKIRFGDRLTADHPIAKDLLDVDRAVVKKLSVYDNIIYWQVENEPLIGNVNRLKIEPSLIAAEVDVVRNVDFKKRPIILNHAATGFYDKSWKDLLLILKPDDVFAVNAFFKTKGTDLFSAKLAGREIHILWPDHLVWPVHSWMFLSPNFDAIKKEVEETGFRFWVLEMQAEPYIKKLDEAVDPLLSFESADIAVAERFLRSYQIESVGLWGAHFWQYRESLGDDSWMRTVKAIVN